MSDKIIAICSGGDWADASVEHLILPKGVSLDEEYADYQDWYQNEFMVRRCNGENVEYMSLVDWLRKHGATEPPDDKLEIIFEN